MKRRMFEVDGVGAVYRQLRFCLGLYEHAGKNDETEDDGDEENDDEKRHRLRWCRRDFRRVGEVATRALLLGIALLVTPGTYRRVFSIFVAVVRGRRKVSFSGAYFGTFILPSSFSSREKLALKICPGISIITRIIREPHGRRGEGYPTFLFSNLAAERVR